MTNLLSELGIEAERAAVVHVDDLGMSLAANDGGFAALEHGPATCGSIMVPCPWFPDAAARARANPDLDLGVHLTLNAEYEGYRWGPVLGADSVPTLVDAEGYLPRTVDEVVANADPEEVDRELRAQMDRAVEAGIDVTHVDSHMGTVFRGKFVDSYLSIARDYDLPLFMPATDTRPPVQALAGEGWPMFDGFCADSLGFAPGDGHRHNLERIRNLGPGLNYLICHAAQGGPELDAITDSSHAREFERTFYGGAPGHDALASAGVATLGMRPLRDLLRRRS